MDLKFNADGRFRIIQFTDTHIGNMPFHEDDYRTFKLIRDALATFDADLIVHTGDLIWSDGVKDAHIVFEKLLEVFAEAHKPMAITFGNHDAEEIVTRADLRRIFQEVVPGAVDKQNSFIIEDRESYTVEIKSSQGEQVERVLYFIDSGADAPLEIGTYDWLRPEQVNWFKETADKYRQGHGQAKNIIFQHIPLPEYWQAAENILDGVNHETNEAISAPHLNTGLFANMVLDGETWGMFVGHDHENNFDGLHHGIHLVYGNVSGYQTYGGEERGIRIIDLLEEAPYVETRVVKVHEFDRA